MAVVDLIDGHSVHDVRVSWPLHPELDLAPTGNGPFAGHLVSRDGVAVLQLCYAATASIQAEHVKADPGSHLGWWSDRLETRTPSWLVGGRCQSAAPVAILTLLRTGDAGAITEQAVVMDGAMLVVTWSEHGVRRGLSIDSSRPGAVMRGPFSQAGRMVSTS